ncbi:MAG: hypothetical protein PVH00_00185 [Gemmatimonadota bacterium]|jgi:hypothetical protein
MSSKVAARPCSLLSLLVLAAGCAAGPSGRLVTGQPASMEGAEVRVTDTEPSVLEFPGATVEAVWKILPAVFSILEIPASVIDADARLYGNGRVTETRVAGRATRDLFRCGDDASLSPSQYRVQFGISAQPRPGPRGGVELFVQTTAFGRFVSASRSGTTHCVSNGTLETSIKEQVDIALAVRG